LQRKAALKRIKPISAKNDMIKRLQIALICFLLSIPSLMYSTHIVGGALTYVYNGGSSYTVTLKLYRDCGAGTASLPGSVTITVVGYNGAAFSPSRDITMVLGAVTSVPSNLDPCATPPNPMPCTQQGIYSTTVNNLPPNPGGYHLYYQQTARNLSLSNIQNASCNCIGESFYADIPGTGIYWNEDFLLANGTTSDNGATAWTTTSGSPAPATASVQSNLFEITGANNAVQTWTSQSIDISSYTDGVNLSVNLAESGTLEANDSIRVFYRLNGGPLTPFVTNGAIADDFTTAVATHSGLIGSNVQIVIRVHFDASSPNSEIYRFDDVNVYGSNFLKNSNPSYNLQPPLFLCAGKPFSFDHSASDVDGDSLVYSFYSPYDGENAAGPLDPTFTNNVAQFTPIKWVSGYSALNPLGGAPLTLNPTTGLMEGTPPSLGQFVVGVMVKEYRNGKYMSQTIRDFQFNVVNCPEQISAILKPITVCNGKTVNFQNYGGSTGNNWHWDFGDPAVTTDVSTLNFPSYTYPGPGTYTATLITGYKTNCADTSTAPVNVVLIKSGFTHNATKCVNSPVTFTQTSTSSSNDVIITSLWDFGDGTTSSLQNPTHSYTTGGTYKVLLTLTTNLGCNDTVSKYVTIAPKPIVNAGPDQTVCATVGSVALTGTVANATGGIWTTTGTGVFTPSATTLNANYKASAADTVASNVKLILTSTGNGTCGAEKDTMLVSISHTSTKAYAGPDKTICGITSATISGNLPVIGTGKWTVVSGTATITDPNAATTTVNGLTTPGASYTFRWTITNAACIPSSDDVVITVDLLPTPSNAGTDKTICNTTSTTLAGNTPVVGTGLWTVVSGTAVITTPASPTSGVTGLIPGDTVILKWTITKGLCSNASTVKIMISKAAVVNAGADQFFCTPTNTLLNGAVSGGTTTGIWSTLGDGTFTPNASTLNATYIPGSIDIANKKLTLVLTSTNNNVCSATTDTMNVFFTGFIGIVNVTTTNASCYGNTDGAATVNVTGGVPAYTYFWSTVPAQTAVTATNLGIGTYSVTIKNSKGCTTQATATITQPAPLAINSSVTPISCFGGNNGIINITPTGGTAPYSYVCTPGNQTAVPITNLGIGTYTVTVTDAKSCQLTSTYTITQSTQILTSFSIATVSCFGKNDGAITSSTTGGVPPYTYSWSPGGATSSNVSGLSAGTYTITVTDKLGCSMSSSTLITEPPALALTVASTNETCNYLNDGTAAVTVSGGTPNYTYTWNPGGAKTPTITNLSSATYTVTVKDLKGCTATALTIVTQPPTLSVNLISQTNVSCNGGSNGSVTANPAGGTAPYSYVWTPGNATNAMLSNVPVGTYTVTVNDKNNCTAQKTGTITEPALLVVSSIITNVSCPSGNNGSIKATPAGGTAPYTYLWLPINKTTATVSGLVAGTYTLTVTDGKGCKNTTTHIVAQPQPIVIAFTVKNVSCFNGSDAAVNSSVAGGTAPYAYSWSVAGVNTPDITGLKTGTYILTVTDNAGCKASKTVTITQPLLLTAMASSIDETCNYLNNGSVSVVASGGTILYKYLWQPTADTTAAVTALAAGTYSVTVTDAKGCTVSMSAIVKEPSALNIAFDDQIDVNCRSGSDGAVRAIPTGGTPNYTYLWMPGNSTSDAIFNVPAGTYTVTVTDKNNCQEQNTVMINEPVLPVSVSASSTPSSCFSGSDGTATAIGIGGTPPYTYKWMPGNKTGETVTGLLAGTYTVTATDSKGCESTNTVNVNEPPKIIITTSTVDAACFKANGEAKASVSGGTAPYTYLWSPAGGTTDSAIGLSSGPYSVLVTDANGCSSSASVNVNDKGIPKPTIFNVINVKCFGDSTGSASVSVTGGSGKYTFLWTPTGGTGTTAINLTAGSYTVTVKDSAGCQSLATTSPDIMQPPIIVPAVTTTSVSCFGGNNGTATATATGGVPGYTYTWLPQGTTGTTIQNLSAITYTLQVKDANNCIVKSNYTVIEPPALYLTLSKKAVSCFGGSDGSVAALATAGTPPYSYKWMPGNISGQKLSNLPAGTYTVTATDVKGCTISSSVTIDQPTKIVLVTGSKNATCDLPNGKAYVTVSGGTAPYTYLWPAVNVSMDTARDLYPGPYTVIVKDKNQCSSSPTVIVNKDIAPLVNITSTINVTCYGGTNGAATAMLSGGKAPYSYLWLPSGGTGLTASNLAAGSYTISVTDANGCTAADTTDPEITQPTELSLSAAVDPVKCFGQNNGSATVLAAGGTPGYTYKWLPGAGTGTTIANVTAGTYTVEVKDAKNCKQTITAVIAQPDTLTSSILSSANVNCFNEATGTATVEVKGGTLNYSYNWFPYGGNGPAVSNLAAGSFTVTISDANACITSSTVVIAQPAQSLSATAVYSDVTCFGVPTGSAHVSVVGGSPAYTFKWTPSGGTDSIATKLKANNYYVQIKDTHGCETNISIPISQPTMLLGELLVTQPTCGFQNGSILSQISGGSQPYKYIWAPDSSKYASILGLRPGTYSLGVTDANGCAITLAAILDDIPTPVLTVSSVQNISCFGKNDGAITLNVDKGMPPFKFNWSPYGGDSTTATNLVAGMYTATVIDSLGCEAAVIAKVTEPQPVDLKVVASSDVLCYNDHNGQATVLATGGTQPYFYYWLPINSSSTTNTNLSAGTYTVTTTDQNNCKASVSINIDQPSLLTSAITDVKNNICFNDSIGSITVNVKGGAIPYNYTWSPDASLSGNVIQHLGPGKYEVTVTDANGCKTKQDTTILQPARVITSTGPNDTICAGQLATLTATATGGTGDYYYVWNPTDSVNFGTFITVINANTTYTVTAYDKNGCAGTPDTASVKLFTLDDGNVDVIAKSPVCPGQSIPLSLQTTGVTGTLNYLWNNNLGTTAGPFKVTLYQPNTYIVTVTNQCGVSITDSIRILITPQPKLNMGADTNEICMPGSIQFNDSSVAGDVNDPIISWLWTFGDGTTSSVASPAHTFTQSGQYPVTLLVKTAGGCTSNNGGAPILVDIHPSPAAAFTVSKTVMDLPYDELKCINQSTGAKTYSWDFSDGTTSTELNPRHQYTVIDDYRIRLIVKNQFACMDTAYLDVRTDADIIFPNVFTPSSSGSTGGHYDVKSLTNDVFFPYTSGVVSYKLQVFDRWGELIFESFDVEKGWDGYYNGKLCEQGVYIWKAAVRLSNGKTFNKTGDVTLLR
jgi:gliding motility-associated-like protein